MKRLLRGAAAVILCLCPAMAACGSKKAASSDEAIANAKAMTTTEEKVDYLISQAKSFYKSEQ